ncbi:hypothetical protein [Streptomyces sp. NPDC004050]
MDPHPHLNTAADCSSTGDERAEERAKAASAGQPAASPPAVWEPQVRDVRVQDLAHALAGGWVWIYGERGWRFFTRADYDAEEDTAVTITYADGEVAREAPWPQARLVQAGPECIPTASRPGPARMRPATTNTTRTDRSGRGWR